MVVESDSLRSMAVYLDLQMTDVPRKNQFTLEKARESVSPISLYSTSTQVQKSHRGTKG